MTLKRKCMVSFTALSLLMMLTFSFLTSVQANGQTNSNNIPPDMPQNAVQFNRTDITPAGYLESVQAMEMNVFFYRDATLMINRIISVSVDPNQTMMLTMNVSASPPQGEAVMERTLNFYMVLEPNATLQLQSQLRLLINQTELSAELDREVNDSRLIWHYWEPTQNQWTPVESYMDQNGYLVCNTDHFSTWTVAEVENPEQIPENIHAYTVIGLIVIVTAATALWKRKKP